MTTGKGTCPACGARITDFQAAFKGRDKSFDCHNCGSLIKKTNSETFLAVGAFVTYWLFVRPLDSFLIKAIIFLILCAFIIWRSKYSAMIELVVDRHNDASQNESMSERN